jgi:hypothetical protein
VLGKRILAYLDQDGWRPHDTPQARRTLRCHDRDGGYELTGWLDREAAEIFRSALSPLAAPRPSTDTEIDLRTTTHRDADALVDLASRALSDGALPTEGGERPQIVVTVSLAVLQGRIGTAHLALGGPINTDIARRLACDAEVIPVVLSSRGEPLNIGRATRTVPTAIRRAVLLRDGGVRFRGVQYRLAGATSTISCTGSTTARPAWENCVALCGRHHRLLHHFPWQIQMTSGIPEFYPPPGSTAPAHQPPPHQPRPHPHPPVMTGANAATAIGPRSDAPLLGGSAQRLLRHPAHHR